MGRTPARPRLVAALLGLVAGCGIELEGDLSGDRAQALSVPVDGGGPAVASGAARFVRAASLNEPRARFASLRLDDGRVLVAGGVSGAAAEPRASAELYDPVSDTWTPTGALLDARCDFTLTAFPLADGRPGAIAIGGLGQGGALASSELYDVRAGTWAPGPALPSARAGHAAARLDDGSVLVAGGRDAAVRLLPGGGVEAAGELLAEAAESRLVPLAGGGALLVARGALLQAWSAATNAWRSAGQLGAARAGASATRLDDGRVLITGGGSLSVEVHDPERGTTTYVGALHAARAGHSATRLPDGRVAVIGGALGREASGAEIHQPRWGTWTPGPGSPQLRAGHEAVALEDGRVLVAGGVGPGGEVLSSVELLDAPLPSVVTGEYRLPARLDAAITSRVATELWASVTAPAAAEPGRRHPLLVFLHGNHATCGTGAAPRADVDCSYTFRGRCPEGYTVVPSHRGYDYAASELAARGFVVVSVNANRGITCGPGEADDPAFNLARGRLLLAHLAQLSAWDRGVTAPPSSLGVELRGRLDFRHVGMMGHSRGGEGVRAAYELYREARSPWPARVGQAVTFRALFEIAPVDGQSPRVLDADGVAWHALLPMCDGDVADQQGVRPFDRLLAMRHELRESPKSVAVAWGANHNHFNTEWHASESPGCKDHRALFGRGPGATGSAEQRQIGLRSLLAFFLANVGASRLPSLNAAFDPALPLASATRIDRGYTPSLRPSGGLTLEDFSGETGRSARGLPLITEGLTLTHAAVPEHDPSSSAALLSWRAAWGGAARALEIPLSAAAAGLDLGRYSHLELRAGRARGGGLHRPTPLTVQLVNADGSRSAAVDAAEHGLVLDGPVGGPYGVHVVLQSVRLPLDAFDGATLGAVRGVRFGFSGPDGAEIYLASLRVSLGTGRLAPVTGRGPRPPANPDPEQDASGEPTKRSQLEPAAQRGGTPPGHPAGPPLATEQPPAPLTAALADVAAPLSAEVLSERNEVIALRRARDGTLELELYSSRPFAPRGDVLMLELGALRSVRSHHPDGALNRVRFTLDAEAFAAEPGGAAVSVRYASAGAGRWDFGPLDEARTLP